MQCIVCCYFIGHNESYLESTGSNLKVHNPPNRNVTLSHLEEEVIISWNSPSNATRSTRSTWCMDMIIGIFIVYHIVLLSIDADFIHFSLVHLVTLFVIIIKLWKTLTPFCPLFLVSVFPLLFCCFKFWYDYTYRDWIPRQLHFLRWLGLETWKFA